MNQSVEQQVECATCTWDKFCIKPPNMTKDEVERNIKEAGDKGKEKGKPNEDIFGSLMGAMMFSGKDKECHACPTFINRLRQSPDLSNNIKRIMKEC